jgi:hypothetical protein
MEKLFSLEYGIGGVCVLLTLMVLLRVGEFVWKIVERKEKVSEKTLEELVHAVREASISMKFIDERLKLIEAAVSEIPKMKTDLRRFYAAMKEVAGDKWPSIRDEITKDGFTL